MWIPEKEWRYVSAAEMRAADLRCIEGLGIPGAVLMYNAGRAVFSALRELSATGPIGIVCGKGNNGGDGFVVGMLALHAGRTVRLVLLGSSADLKGDARLYHDAFVRSGGGVQEAATEAEASQAVAALSGCAVLVDAILGTGFTGAVRGVPAAAIATWPSLPTVAVDVPSGMNADTGAVSGACIRADVTVTFQAAKFGFRVAGAGDWLGRVRVADIGIPAQCFGAAGVAPAACRSFREHA